MDEPGAGTGGREDRVAQAAGMAYVRLRVGKELGRSVKGPERWCTSSYCCCNKFHKLTVLK